MSIRLKVILSVVLVFALGAGIVVFALSQGYERNVTAAAVASVERDRAVFTQLQADDTAKLSATALALQQNAAYRDAFLAGDRERLLALTEPVFAQLKADYAITHWYFESTKDKGDVFLRVHKPQQHSDVLKRKTYLQAVETGKPAAGLELGATAVALRVVRPYYGADGSSVVGYVELGQEIDEFLGEIKEQTGDDVALLLVKESMDSSGWAAMRETAGLEDNWAAHDTYVLAASTDEDAADLTYDGAVADVDAEGEVVGRSGSEVRGVFPVLDAAGERIGLVLVRHDISDTEAALRGTMLRVLATVLVMLVLVLATVVVLMNSLVFGRLDRMIEGMEDISLRLAGGDFDVVYQADGKDDEIGRFQTFFAQFIAMTAGALKQLSEQIKH